MAMEKTHTTKEKSGNGLFLRRAGKPIDQASAVMSFISEEFDSIMKSVKFSAPKARKFLRENWKPILATASVLAVGIYLWRNNRKSSRSSAADTAANAPVH